MSETSTFRIYPLWVWIVRILIFALAATIIGLAAYEIRIFDGTYNTVPSLLIFASIKTFVIYGVIFATESRAKHLFYRMAVYGAYLISIIFWLAAWGWSAAHAAIFRQEICDDTQCEDPKDNPVLRTAGIVMSACAGLGAALWVLSIVNLACFIKARKKFASLKRPSEDQIELGEDPSKDAPPEYGYYATAHAQPQPQPQPAQGHGYH